MGRKRLYHTEEERRAAKRASNEKSRARKKGKGKSWLKEVEKRVEAATSDEVETPKGSGDPFADLPPLDLPSTSPDVASDADGKSSETATDAPGATPDSSSASESEPKQPIFDTKVIEGMAEEAVEQAVRAMGVYASERGFMALGDPFPRVAGMGARVLIHKYAAATEMSDEDAAVWMLGIPLGFNGVQAGRAWMEEKRKKEEAERKAKTHAQQQRTRQSEPGSPGAADLVNGTHSRPPVTDEVAGRRLDLPGPIV